MPPAHLPRIAPFDAILFGGTGDLSMRKVLPALLRRDADEQLDAHTRILALSLDALDDDAYRTMAAVHLRAHVPDVDTAVWTRFLARLGHIRLDATDEAGSPELVARLGQAPDRVRVFYLATSPSLYGTICRLLARQGLVHPECRVVLEKPLGHDLASSRAIHDAVAEVFTEEQVYRIDHYLGKETVQNLMALRFANALFEPMWNSSYVDHVQITVAERLGVEDRATYYDRYGAVRDMLQNHILQLLCLLAMEPPAIFDAGSVRDEKLKVLRALRPKTPEGVARDVVFGQYAQGAVGGTPVPGYLDEPGIPAGSRTESFVAAKLHIDNWRWAGVPFYVRTGKRMETRASEIVVRFKPLPHMIFPDQAHTVVANQLILRLQPAEGIRLVLMTKTPGPGGIRLRAAALNLGFAETFKEPLPDAYERLLLDVAKGNQTLFMSRHEVEEAWKWVDPILASWNATDRTPARYAAGSWGPSSAVGLIERDGRSWVMPGEEP